ncbi:multi-pass transmembrane protein [Cryptosporidium felis]|nr:multi-pass transmembrane protein [Cryptosporidium felis]
MSDEGPMEITLTPEQVDHGVVEESPSRNRMSLEKEINNRIFGHEMAKSNLVFDEFPFTKLLLTFFAMLFITFGAVNTVLGFARLGLMSLVISMFLMFFRFGEKNRQHSSCFVLAVISFTSIFSWNAISNYIQKNEGTTFEEKIYPLLILEFSASLFLSLWLLLITLSGYSDENQRIIYVNGEKYQTNANLQFTAFSAFSWYLIAMGSEFAIFILYLLEESYIVAVIPFLSLLISNFYVMSKSRRVLQYSEILLPFIMLAYVILRMIYDWVAPNDYSSLIGAFLVTIMVIKQVIGLSILFIPNSIYSDIINDSGSYSIAIVLSYKVREKGNQTQNEGSETDDSGTLTKTDSGNKKNPKEGEDGGATVVSVDTKEILTETPKQALVESIDESSHIELTNQLSHTVVIEEDPEANIPYNDSIKIGIQSN